MTSRLPPTEKTLKITFPIKLARRIQEEAKVYGSVVNAIAAAFEALDQMRAPSGSNSWA